MGYHYEGNCCYEQALRQMRALGNGDRALECHGAMGMTFYDCMIRTYDMVGRLARAGKGSH